MMINRKSLFFKKIITLLLGSSFLFFTPCSHALPFRQEWDVNPDAAEYEYQISESDDFKDDYIVKSGSTKENFVEFNLKAGLYFFRIRVIGRESREKGYWSKALRFKLVDDSLRILRPQNQERVPLLSQSSELNVEWNGSSDDVDDFLLRVTSPENKVTLVQTQSTQVGVPKLYPGKWTLQLSGRRKGLEIFSSPPIEVILEAKGIYAPRLLYPVDLDEVLEFAEFDIRWLRRLKGQRSEILIARADQNSFPVVFRQEIHQSTGFFTMTGMPSGIYQLSIRDYNDANLDFVESTITINVTKNPKDQQPEDLRFSSRMLLGPLVGIRSLKSPNSFDGSDFESRSSTLSWIQFEGRSQWRFFPKNLLEFALGSGRVSQSSQSSDSRVENFIGPSEGFARLSYARELKILPRLTEFWISFSLEYLYWRAPVYSQDLRANSNIASLFYTMQNFGTFGFGAGATGRMRLKPRTHLEFSTYLPLPFLVDLGSPAAHSGLRIGEGKSAKFYLPKFELYLLLRHKFSREFWLNMGIRSVLGYSAVTENSGQTLIKEFSLSPRLGLEWDF